MARLASEFIIPIEMVEGVGYVLEKASRSYWTQTNRPQINRIEVRKELTALVKAAGKLRDVISQLHPRLGTSLSSLVNGKNGTRIRFLAF